VSAEVVAAKDVELAALGDYVAKKHVKP